MDINNSITGNLRNTLKDYSVDDVQIDSPTDQKETTWTNEKFTQYMGYYKKIPELGSAIDTKAYWVVGKGYEADEATKKILDNIRGWGKDTFNTIIENMIRTYNIGGDAFAEIIKNKRGVLINLKILNPATIKIVVHKGGIIKKYIQTVKKSKISFKPEEVFHLAWNRIADEIHGTSIIEKIENIILMRNEAMTDIKTVFHRYVKQIGRASCRERV